jgi:uncharacterized membrane protein (DUF2068 family)
MNNTVNTEELQITPTTTSSRRDMIFVLLSLVLGFLFCDFILFGGLGVSVPLFVIISYTVTLIYISKGKIIINKDAIITVIPVILLSACFVLYDNQLLRFFNFDFLIFFSMLNLSYLTGVSEFHFFETGSFWDFIKAFFVFPFANLDKSVKSISLSTKNSTKASRILMAIAGIIVISPVAIIIIVLLMSSDAAFQSLISNIFKNFKDLWAQNLFKFIIAIILTFPIFSFLYSILNKNHNFKINTFQITKAVKIVDSLFANSALWVICMIYVLYIFTQLNYFISAFFNTLPSGLTYAEYARRGFFELVAVTFINLILIIFSIAFTKRKEYKIKQSSRVTIFSLSLLTIMLIATAVSKMVMYIGFYGLTLLRIYTSWFMVVLLCIFLLLCIKMFSKKFKLMRVAAIIITMLYIGLNFANVDALIPQYNIYKYKQNPSKGIDVTMFYQLSSSMIPQAQQFADDLKLRAADFIEKSSVDFTHEEQTISNELYEVNNLLMQRRDAHYKLNWQNFSFAGYEGFKGYTFNGYRK